MIPQVNHNLARQTLTCWAFLFYTNMIYSRVTKVKTRSGLDILVKEQDLDIRNKINDSIIIELTVLKFPLLMPNKEEHPKESTEYFHRDEIVWFKNQWL